MEAVIEIPLAKMFKIPCNPLRNIKYNYLIKKKIVRQERTEKEKKPVDEDGIRTHACRAHWISSPTP